MTKDKFISPSMLNRLHKADNDLNELIKVIKEDSMTFSHLCSYDYMTKVVIPTYKSKLNIIDIRVICENVVDVETDMFITTFYRKSAEEGITSCSYDIINDIEILVGTVSEVELEDGYMDECNIYPILNSNKFHFVMT